MEASIPGELSDDGGRFRLLSLDGGGIRGVFTASFLAALEEDSGCRVVDHFDLIVGTSTGGIIALGLGLGLRPAEILEFYTTRGPAIFGQTGVRLALWTRLRHFLMPKYRPEALRSALNDVFGERRVGESKSRLVVVGYDASTPGVHLFKTAHDRRFKRDYKVPAVDVALATSAASTYFPAFCDRKGVTFIDGGVWANNPTMVGILEAVAVLDVPHTAIEVLSIGTTRTPDTVGPKLRFGGKLSWAPGVADFLLGVQQQAIEAQANLMTEHERIVRVDPVVARDRFALDGASDDQIQELRALGVQQARHRAPEVERRFLQTPAAEFIPFHRL